MIDHTLVVTRQTAFPATVWLECPACGWKAITFPSGIDVLVGRHVTDVANREGWDAETERQALLKALGQEGWEPLSVRQARSKTKP